MGPGYIGAIYGHALRALLSCWISRTVLQKKCCGLAALGSHILVKA